MSCCSSSNKSNYTFLNGNYYIDPINNNLPKVKGRKYTSNGILIYEDGF